MFVHHLYAGKPERLLQTIMNWKCHVVVGIRTRVPLSTEPPLYCQFSLPFCASRPSSSLFSETGPTTSLYGHRQGLALLPVAQSGSKLLGSSDPPVSAFPVARRKCLPPIDLL